MAEKGILKSYEKISTDVKYGQKPKQNTAEEVTGRFNNRGYGL